MAERVGFEPTAPFGVTGFQDQLLKPLGHLSGCVLLRYYITQCQSLSSTFLLIFFCFCVFCLAALATIDILSSHPTFVNNYFTIFLYFFYYSIMHAARQRISGNLLTQGGFAWPVIWH